MASPNLSNAAAIVGAAEADIIGYREELTGHKATSLQLHIEAINNVCKYTGIPISDIQGVFSAGWTGELAEHLGIHPRYLDTTSVGGCSFQIHVHHALAAIHAGIIDIALVSHGEAGWSYRGGGGGGGGRGGAQISPGAEMSMAYGTFGAPSQYAHAMVRHFHDYGTTLEDFAHIAVVTRDWAQLNPRAVMYGKAQSPFGGPITVQDVVDARIIAWPLTLYNCCLVTDHGGAVIVARPEIARELATNPVWITGAGESIGHQNMLEMEDFTATSASRSSATAYEMAGLGSRRHGNGDDLRLVHDHSRHHRRDARPRATRQGLYAVEERRRGPGRTLADQHQRRRALVQPLGHVRHAVAGRSLPAVVANGGRRP